MGGCARLFEVAFSPIWLIELWPLIFRQNCFDFVCLFGVKLQTPWRKERRGVFHGTTCHHFVIAGSPTKSLCFDVVFSLKTKSKIREIKEICHTSSIRQICTRGVNLIALLLALIKLVKATSPYASNSHHSLYAVRFTLTFFFRCHPQTVRQIPRKLLTQRCVCFSKMTPRMQQASETCVIHTVFSEPLFAKQNNFHACPIY